jgi:predicted dinucleotide-binding enzyme
VTTAIIGVGNIGGALARRLVRGGEHVMLAAKDESKAAALAGELGPLASAASVRVALDSVALCP